MTDQNKPAPKKRAPRKKKSEGLGDTIEKVTEATGIKAVVKAVVGDDCGCDERKQKLNEMFPYAKDAKMDDRQKTIWESVIVPAWATGRLKGTESNALMQLFEEMGIKKRRWRRCGGCAKRALEEMRTIYEASCETKS